MFSWILWQGFFVEIDSAEDLLVNELNTVGIPDNLRTVEYNLFQQFITKEFIQVGASPNLVSKHLELRYRE